jgi:alpha-glucosidase
MTFPVPAQERLTSPDGRLALTFSLETIDGRDGSPVYRVDVQGRPLIGASGLGFRLADGTDFTQGYQFVRAERSEHDDTWEPVYGERSRVRDHYRQLKIHLRRTAVPHDLLVLTFRCFDTGVAWCYRLLAEGSSRDIVIAREQTEFRFLGDHTAWTAPRAQAKYRRVPLSQLGQDEERPLTVQVRDDLYVALAEAALVDYARMKLARVSDSPHSLVSQLSSEVKTSLPLTTPWRVVMVAASPGELLENNDILLNLNEPCALSDTSWIKPGKVIREVTLTTTGGKACVDFAVRHNLQYVEYDAGWYGHEYDDSSDATTITVDPKRSPGPLDLHEVIRYGRERDIGIIVYVNRRALERQLDEILPLYQGWGIKGVKYGFVNVGSQQWTSWLHEAVRKAAAHRLMVDVHDEYRPTGYSRTYPNFMTMEGIGGDETSPTNDQTLTILFTRMLAGAGDNTICYFNSRVKENASHAYQLAKAVCIYSPWQFLFWYDRPDQAPREKGGAGGEKGNIVETPELEFYDHVPTVWDDTKVLHGRIGEYAVIARRSGDNWFIGGMNSGQARILPVTLDFLKPGVSYASHTYADDPAMHTPTQVRIERDRVTSGTVLRIPMGKQGGFAVRLVPES